MRASSKEVFVACVLAAIASWLALRKSEPAAVCPVTKTALTPEQLADPNLLATRPDGSTVAVCCEGCKGVVQSGRA